MISTREELETQLTSKFIIIDSCVILPAYNYREEFFSFFSLFTTFKCSIIRLPFIDFEVLRSTTLETDYQKFKTFLNTFIHESNLNDSLSIKSFDLVHKALEIARLYHKKNIKSASFIDCYILAILSKSPNDIFLVTENHFDFPLLLFDHIYTHPINVETKSHQNKIYTPAFYKFNTLKASAHSLLD